jgi:hypothetical protein
MRILFLSFSIRLPEFASEPRAYSFYRVFNMGSPINVSPGRGSGDLRAVAAHYERRNQLTEEKRLAKLKDGKVVSIYDDERLF